MTLPAKWVSRKQWGASPPRSKPTVLLASAVDTIVFHYTAANADEQADHRNCAGRVRGIQHYHQHTKGWNDIAYNFLVCKHGYVFEGRGIKFKSAATGADNGHTLAVCFLGDDTKGRDDVTGKGREGLVEVTRYIRELRPKAVKRRGHRDFMNTSCPGDEIYHYIHSDLFTRQLAADEKAALRKQILRWRAAGWGWTRIKQTAVWQRFKELGGK